MGLSGPLIPCKVAVGGDEGYLLCAAVAVWIVSTRNRFSLGVLQRGDANRIVMAAWMCTWCCKTHCNGYMNVAWDLCWGGSRSTKRCVFPYKVAAGGDEGYLLCAAVAVWIVSTRNRFSLGVLQRGNANRTVMAAWMCTWCCKTHCNGCMNVAWDLCWEGSRSTKPCVFLCKVAAGGDEGYPLCVPEVESVLPWCSATCGCSRVRISMRLLNLWF